MPFAPHAAQLWAWPCLLVSITHFPCPWQHCVVPDAVLVQCRVTGVIWLSFVSFASALREKRTAVVAQLKQLQSETEPIVKMFEDPETTRQMQSTRWVGARAPAALQTHSLPLVKTRRRPQMRAGVSTRSQKCYKHQQSTERWQRCHGTFSTISRCSICLLLHQISGILIQLSRLNFHA